MFPVEEALALCEDGVESIIIAPDDLHKANTSGGEPYEIEVPDLGADGKFLNERHELYLSSTCAWCSASAASPATTESIARCLQNSRACASASFRSDLRPQNPD